MANKSIEERVAFLEKSMGGKTIDEHFREHAELIDRRFGEVYARFAAIDARFNAIDLQFVAVHARFDAMDERFNRVDSELGFLRRDLALVLQKLSA
jgi:hypothetical protein